MAEREFGSLLRELRTDARMTIEELSEASGVSVRAIGDMERGKVSSPQRRTAEALADGLKLAAPDHTRLLATLKTRPRAGALAQLPADLPVFTGRRAELRQALALLDRNQEAPAVVIGAIGGMAGVGKTALALHWAHRIAESYPDGQLWVDLRGFDQSGQVLDAGQALGGFLRALGVADSRIPVGTDDRAALFRSKLAGRRVLIVLDNARDSEQVRPLLPATTGCLAIVTSRNQLTGLAATHGARMLTLDVWTPEEAREALARRLGADRVAAEPEAVTQLLELCGHLPLAVAVVAARAAARPSFALADIAAELSEAHGTLDAFHAPDGADPRAVFSWSYQALSPDAARLFRLLGLHPGPDITLPAAASLAALPPRRARVLLAECGAAHLVTEHAPGRWRLHDLLRAYAAETAEEYDGPAERRRAFHRLLDHLLHSAHAADQVINPVVSTPIEPAPARPGVVVDVFPDRERAAAWAARELQVIWAAQQQAEALGGFDSHLWQLAWTTVDAFSGHVWSLGRESLAFLTRAAEAVKRDPGGAPYVTAVVGWVAMQERQIGRPEEAKARLLALLRPPVPPLDRARVHHDLGWLHGELGEYDDALRHSLAALGHYRDVGNEPGHARELASVAWYQAQLGRYDDALVSCEQAIARLAEQNMMATEASAWDTLGYVHHHLGDHGRAITCYRRSLDLYRHTGRPAHEAEVLEHLGDAHHALGEAARAESSWQRALDLLIPLDHSGAERLRAKLSATAVID
ncbi:helix-turn-helix domain-containing protein [Nonomuraea candida]|uniref:helix-turn-helix domain-containing protein n=1 Tax=Nonomuraea candida TaxID=359159 RepID=UPI0005BD9C71|nr:helix-turn-helix domain-containing protein [Nonomuraea candida]